MRSAKFPCGVCSKNCISTSSALFCGTCEQWFHAKCQNVGASTYEKWSSLADLDYICTMCRTTDGINFDYLMGIERLRRVSFLQKFESLDHNDSKTIIRYFHYIRFDI